ncbi:iron chaperone [Ligilactobacillus animalis]|uniref:iron chaperone n=1 Tax=Ligilactobacillus animalis TaxID=1605 RepID=UPI002FD9FD73
MEQILEYIQRIDDPDNRLIFGDFINWLMTDFPELKPEYKWNQPMFTHHGTFIIGFSVAMKHFTVAPEMRTFEHFLPQIKDLKLKHGKKTFQLQFGQNIPYDLLRALINYTLADKQNVTSFWDKRKVGE